MPSLETTAIGTSPRLCDLELHALDNDGAVRGLRPPLAMTYSRVPMSFALPGGDQQSRRATISLIVLMLAPVSSCISSSWPSIETWR